MDNINQYGGLGRLGSQNKRLLLSGHNDGHIEIWDLEPSIDRYSKNMLLANSQFGNNLGPSGQLVMNKHHINWNGPQNNSNSNNYSTLDHNLGFTSNNTGINNNTTGNSFINAQYYLRNNHNSSQGPNILDVLGQLDRLDNLSMISDNERNSLVSQFSYDV